MFGRRRSSRHGRGAAGRHANSGQAEGTANSDTPPVSPDRPAGPWDVAEPAPDLDRVDLGALRVPGAEGLQFQLNVMDDEIVAVTLSHQASTLQMQVFAAPKSEQLWDWARGELATELAGSGSPVTEARGPFGTELRAELYPTDQEGRQLSQPARFVGVDGPRWLLRGLFTGPAGSASGDPGQAEVLEEIFRGVVVVRGEEPLPSSERLTLRMPDTRDQRPDTETHRPAGPETGV